eukprot:TRINITY_DN4812_c0_g1_i3.p1 TRINITY_DN4812_c0_g1~~TRINITY_DN4812_c0_g1_i3.p1  ORF type:complete len:318 (-),score=68.89 TRINITY_DN4812_c0_g1_i3:524-1477(-)
MSFLDQLRNKRGLLQSVQVRETSWSTSSTLEQLKINKERADANNVDKWYDSLKEVLIPSHLLPLSLDQAKALVRVYESKNMNKPSLTVQELESLDVLAKTIEEHTLKWRADVLQRGFFVRLNTRSPKDSLILEPLMFEAIKKDCDKHEQEGGKVDDNTILRFCYVNFVKKMIVYSGKQAVDLLGKSHRIWQDISAAIESIVDKFEMFVVLREWVQIHPSMEFRGFVYGRKLNAISSYNRAVCWPGIPERKEEIEKKCRDYWEKLEPLLPSSMQNFVVDFAFLEGTGEPTVVEFNDFADFEGLFLCHLCLDDGRCTCR